LAELDYLRVEYREPHLARTKEILAKHPEVRQLFGNVPTTALFVLGIVGLQAGMAYLLRDRPWWASLLAAWFVGALANHALWVLIHECSHNLVFKKGWPNALLQIVANLPIVVPSAISFRKYHLLHHNHQGVDTLDADLASPFEAKVVGNTAAGKIMWLLLFPLFQALRIPRLKNIKFVDRWYVLNFVVQFSFDALVIHYWGWSAFGYLALATFFSVGLHPVGARWIQEHYLTGAPQETYSYYGPYNVIAFNVGYHNEHHDLMRVPWTRLPELKRMAPEFYDNLKFHTSWTRLLLQFIFDPKLSLYSRVTRPGGPNDAELANAAPVIPGDTAISLPS
jgi:sphingolipid delta-4 desaturase